MRMPSRAKGASGSATTDQWGLPVRSLGGWTIRTVSTPPAAWYVLPSDARTAATDATGVNRVAQLR